MCRWLAYSGTPILLEDLLVKPKHSLIDQSFNAQHGATTTNGDGFGVGWYGNSGAPALYRGVQPAWNDRNLDDLTQHIRSGLVFAHIRASTGSPVQLTNCHPFRYRNWLWMHNGAIADFQKVKRDLVFAVDPSLYSSIEGSTDSEVLFFLALTFGLAKDPPGAVERAVGFIEMIGKEHGIEHPVQMTVATSDGRSIWIFRYSSVGQSRSLFYSTKVGTLRDLYPENPVFQSLSDESSLVVSEPLSDLKEVWQEVPEASCGIIREGADDLIPFTPTGP